MCQFGGETEGSKVFCFFFQKRRPCFCRACLHPIALDYQAIQVDCFKELLILLRHIYLEFRVGGEVSESIGGLGRGLGEMATKPLG